MPEEKVAAKRAAFRLLGMKGYHSQELRKKLELKGYGPEAVDHALAECRRLGFLNDGEYVRSWAERLRKKGYGPRYIAAKMRSKGIPAPALGEDQEEEIRRLVEGRFKNKDKRKTIAALQRRGFDLESIFKVICNN